MVVQVSEPWASFIRSQVQSGRYASEVEVLDDALRLLSQREPTGAMAPEAGPAAAVPGPGPNPRRPPPASSPGGGRRGGGRGGRAPPRDRHASRSGSGSWSVPPRSPPRSGTSCPPTFLNSTTTTYTARRSGPP